MLALEAHVQAHGRGRHILRAALASAVPVDGDNMEGVVLRSERGIGRERSHKRDTSVYRHRRTRVCLLMSMEW